MSHIQLEQPTDSSRLDYAILPHSGDLFEGPDDLTAMLMPYFDPDAAGINNLGRLIKLLYHASLVPDEGRYPRFRVICGRESFGHTIAFAAPVPRMNSVEAIRRLAPAVSDLNTALRLVDDGAGGYAALQILDFQEHSVRSNPEEFSEVSLPDGTLTVRVDGPGELRATIQPGPVFHLRGNRIRSLVAFDKAVTPFRDLVSRLCSKLRQRFETVAQKPLPSPDILVDGFLYMWATMMADVINSPHGGAFLIVPPRDGKCVETKFQAAGNLFTAFEGTVMALAEKVGDDGSEARKFWLLQRDHLLRVARMFGQLTGTDGAVLFDTELNLCGFGTKIIGATPHLPLFDAVTQRPYDERLSTGMRHRSAAELVRAVPGAMAFVISQDGDLTSFYSNEEKAFRLSNLDAWGTVSDFL